MKRGVDLVVVRDSCGDDGIVHHAQARPDHPHEVGDHRAKHKAWVLVLAGREIGVSKEVQRVGPSAAVTVPRNLVVSIIACGVDENMLEQGER